MGLMCIHLNPESCFLLTLEHIRYRSIAGAFSMVVEVVVYVLLISLCIWKQDTLSDTRHALSSSPSSSSHGYDTTHALLSGLITSSILASLLHVTGSVYLLALELATN